MRLLIVTRFIDRSEAYIIGQLRQSGVSIHIVCDPRTRHYQELEAQGIKITPLEFRSRLSMPAIRALHCVLRAEAFDIIHAVDSRGLANVLWASYGMKVRIIAYRGTVGGVTWLDPGCWMAHLHPKVKRIVCVSEAVGRV